MTEYELIATIFHGLLGLFSLLGIVYLASERVKYIRVPYETKVITVHYRMNRVASQMKLELDGYGRKG